MKCEKCGKKGPVFQFNLCTKCFLEWVALRAYIFELFLKGEYLPVREKK